jgi:Tol biopolymer transport system component
MNLYMKSSSGAGPEQMLFEDSTNKSPSSWSHNGQFLLYASRITTSDSNLWVLPLSGGQKPIPYMQTIFNETGARFSPDDRWVVYGSNESGQTEIYVAPFPETGAKRLVSTAGAAIGTARWRSNGRELFCVTPELMLMTAEIDGRGPEIKVGRVTPLFKLPIAPGLGTGTLYDVAGDGQRFLVTVGGGSGAPASLSLVTNWATALTKE